MKRQTINANAMKGALIADAASFGTHWIYDVGRIADIASKNNGVASFVKKDPDNYEGVASYFAHANRNDGSNTQYGEVLKTAIGAIVENDGAFDVSLYQERFAAHFGPGGTYIGYIDRATRGTLDNITNEVNPSGTEDMQCPALATLPAILSVDDNAVEAATRVTNNNEVSVAAANIFKTLLGHIHDGADLLDALSASKDAGNDAFSELIHKALATEENDSIAYGEITGRACNLVMALPLIFHILKHTSSFEEAVETNIRASGDNAGRAIMLGAIAGAFYSLDNMPENWKLAYSNCAQIFSDCDELAGL